jgi:hypothetical protein
VLTRKAFSSDTSVSREVPVRVTVVLRAGEAEVMSIAVIVEAVLLA